MGEIREIHSAKQIHDVAQQDIVDVLVKMLERARAGELQSVYIAAMLTEHKGIATNWAWTEGQPGNPTEMVLHLIALQHDIMGARR